MSRRSTPVTSVHPDLLQAGPNHIVDGRLNLNGEDPARHGGALARNAPEAAGKRLINASRAFRDKEL